jgi:hypothetical protein
MKGRAILAALGALWLCGCTTLRPAVSPIPEATEYRQVQEEIHHQQAELAVTGERIEEGSRSIAEGIVRLEESITNAAPDFGDAEREDWLNQVRELRSEAEEHHVETEKLNQQLARERETTRREGELFDEREVAWQQAVSELGTENAALRGENKKIAGQRNVLFIIAVSLAGAWAVYIAYKISKIFR